MSSSSKIFIYAVTPDCGTLLVILILVFDDVSTQVILSVWWVVIFLILVICLFLDSFLLFSIFSDVILVLVSICWRYLIVFILGIVIFFCDWDNWAPHKNWIPLSNFWTMLLSGQLVWPLYDLIIDIWKRGDVSRRLGTLNNISAIAPTVLFLVILVVPM